MKEPLLLPGQYIQDMAIDVTFPMSIPWHHRRDTGWNVFVDVTVQEKTGCASSQVENCNELEIICKDIENLVFSNKPEGQAEDLQLRI